MNFKFKSIRNIKPILIIVFLLVQALSCLEPYDVRSINFKKAIVVEGRLTNKSGENYVKLSYTRPVEDQNNVPLAGATVWVESSDGSKIAFTETESGFYLPTEGMAGQEGKSYQLFFATVDGRQYQSSMQELNASPPIDSIYVRYAEKASSTSGEVNKGIQFLVDTHDDSNRAKYYKYGWEETYEVQAPFPSLYSFSLNPDTAISRQALGETVHVCYVTAKSSSIDIGSTANLTENRLSEKNVRFLTSETDHLRYAYSILVKQYVISAEAYRFYSEMLENNQDNESLFDKQLGVVAGNVTSVDNPDETVLGYFEVAGVSEKRMFVRFEELDPRFPWPDQSYPCAPNQVVTIIDSVQPLPYKLKDSVAYFFNQGFEIHIGVYCDSLTRKPPPWLPPCPFYFRAQMAPRYCTDCRFRGPVEKPEFWIY